MGGRAIGAIRPDSALIVRGHALEAGGNTGPLPPCNQVFAKKPLLTTRVPCPFVEVSHYQAGAN